uniref:ubiquitinyl hydrolase 1 n=1 Tax=Tetraodon nigroviridis TaxID=99883 RepID=H3CKN5_TETNG
MTVEQNVLQQHSQKGRPTFPGVITPLLPLLHSRVKLHLLLQASDGDMTEAVAFLTEKNVQASPQDESSYDQTSQLTSDRYISVGSQADTNVIDLTGDDKDDLQRAIALSLAESSRAFRETGITDEEQAISRVLEASIAENKATLKRSHLEAWSDSPNPHERKRTGSCPVGLKNVGNTCWFSAVIQSLFNLLEFQRLVLNYSPPVRVEDLPRNQKEQRNLPFMQELRNLFSLMVGSKRKYVDPSRAVEILKEAFKSSESQQQDVSEFSHKLLDWLEDAFQKQAEGESETERAKNPMVELFYGHFLAVGVLEGKKFENPEMFGQYPLQVNGFKDLHECLEAAMNEGEIESAENCSRSGQEHWFTELPPVLTFELSRFEFNQTLGRPEKIHNKLEFPSMLYMDRYMDKNREITRIKREEIRRLKEHLSLLQQRMERYMSYGSGPKRLPLADVLQYALEFASSKPVCMSPVEDLDSSAPPGGAAGSPGLSPSSLQQDCSPPSGPSTAPPAVQPQRTAIHKPFTQSRLPAELPAHPAPRHISPQELQVLESCFHRWRAEVEKDIHDLQGSISRIHRTVELMYSDKSMMQVPYRLHAVLVHEGQANAGHYWAYIYDPRQHCWMKYNDITVTKSSWEELVRDSFGGYRNASAYCLMYIDDKKPFLIEEEFDKETGQVLCGMDKLPPDLRQYVKDDNQLFENEIKEWDILQALKAQPEKPLAEAPAATSASASRSLIPNRDPGYMDQLSPESYPNHLQQDTERAIARAAAEESPEALLNAAMKLEFSRLLKLAQEDTAVENDYRLQHVIIYFIQNQAPRRILERTLLSQFANRNLALDERCKSVVNVARAKLDLVKSEDVGVDEYEMWHRTYRTFCETTLLLVTGLELFQKSSYSQALAFLVYSYQYNKELLSGGLYRGHHQELIGCYRRACLLELNHQAAAMFESGEEPEVSRGLGLMNELVVPCIPLLLAHDADRDLMAVEDMRNRWCSYLGQEMEPHLQEKLTDFLPKLLDCSAETRSFQKPPALSCSSAAELHHRFSSVMASLASVPPGAR